MKSYTYARAFQAALIGIAMTGLATLATRTSTIMSSNSSTTVKKGRTLTRGDLHDAIMAGAVERVRPKMTVVAIMAGLPPIMWSTGTGSEIMQRIAVPMISGMILSTLLTLIVIPAIFGIVKGFRLPDEPNADVPVKKGRPGSDHGKRLRPFRSGGMTKVRLSGISFFEKSPVTKPVGPAN